ncbi:MAG: adenylate kinase [Clostridiaceae bacterium]|nr:adenylate kinase [Clostridiaceae bacterium]
MQLVLLGAPGSGKGTLAADLKNIYDIPHISTGDIFRRNISNKTELGLKADAYISKGQLVPDDITINMVADRLSEPDCSEGFLLDGFPRTIPQADALNDIMKKLGRSLTAVIDVTISDELVLKRLTNRRVCSNCGLSYNLISMPPKQDGICDKCSGKIIQRKDDSEDTIKKRLETYHKQTQPLVDYYRDIGLIFDVSNEGKPEEAVNKVRKYFE